MNAARELDRLGLTPLSFALCLVATACTESSKGDGGGDQSSGGTSFSSGGTSPDASTAGASGTGAAASGGSAAGGGAGTASGGTIGSGGATGSGGAAGSGGGATITCGSSICGGWILSGVVEIPPCCVGGVACGADISNVVAGVIGVPPGCHALEQAGNVDCTACSKVSFQNPAKPGSMTSYDGCCRSSSVCGVHVDLQSQAGPKLGCIEGAAYLDGGAAKSCTPGASPPPDGGCP